MAQRKNTKKEGKITDEAEGLLECFRIDDKCNKRKPENGEMILKGLLA